MSRSVIQILDENTANKIAAGEVVERPSSVVKELIENAIDAGSTNIEVEIENGGSQYIRVTDNGCGMSQEDAKLAILRHATSKIRTAEDLSAIYTLGFRGEALPSIAAVSKFVLTTRLCEETLATYVEVQGGTIIDIREAGASIGTTITVSDLFFNTPARRKFLKTVNTESAHINDIIGRLALSHPEVAFKLINGGRHVLSAPGTGKLADAVGSIYGHKVLQELLPVDWDDQNIKVRGFISKPTLLKNSRQWQTFLVNSRVVNNRMVSKAIDNAYHATLPKHGYPLAVISIEIPSDIIDVNVHPQKSEVKFSDDQFIYRLVYKAVISALSTNILPETFATPASVVFTDRLKEVPVIHATNTNVISPTSWSKNRSSYETAETAANLQATLWKERTIEPPNLASVRESLSSDKTIPYVTEKTVTQAEFAEHTEIAPLPLPLGQVEECYIIAQGSDGLYIIDQHAAHERIIFNKLSKNADRIPVQQLLVPLVLEIDNNESLLIAEYENIIHELGFTVEPIGPGTVRLVEMPADLPCNKIEEYFRQLIAVISANSGHVKGNELRQAYLQTAACRAAIKAGDLLNMRQIKALIEELWTTDTPYTCPHGRPVIVKFSRDELGKLFKRT